MPSGRSLQTTGQVGEYLVTSQLCRMGFIATTFTRNVPYFDILAIGEDQKTRPIQVKSITGDTWQFNATAYLDIDCSAGIQKVNGKTKLENCELICVLVKLVELGKDEFYILKIKDLQDIICNQYTAYLKQHNGRRPKKQDSTHTAVHVKQLSKYRDNWDLISQ